MECSSLQAAGSQDVYDQIIAYYTSAIQMDPMYAKAYFNRGLAYAAKKLYDDAITDFTKAIDITPRYAEAYANRGLAYSSKSEFEKAVEDYNKAIEINPSYAEAYSNRGLAYTELGQHDKALEDYNKALEANPDDAGAQLSREIAVEKKKEDSAAAPVEKKEDEINRENSRIHIVRGLNYYYNGSYDEARIEFRQAIELDKNSKMAQVYMERIDGKKEKLRVQEAQLAAEKHKKEIVFQLSNAKKLYARKEFSQAKAEFVDILIRDPENRDARIYLEFIEEKLRQDREQLAAEKRQREIGAFIAEGKTLYASGQYDQSMVEFTSALDLDPGNVIAQKYLGLIAVKEKEIEKREAEAAAERKTEQIRNGVAKGKKFFEKKQYEQSKNEFINVLELDPENKTADSYIVSIEQKERGLLLERAKAAAKQKKEDIRSLAENGRKLYLKKQYEESRDEFIKLLSIEPDDESARKYLKLIDQREEESRREDARQNAKKDKEKLDSCINKAKKLYLNQDYELAKREFIRALELDAENSVATKYLEFIRKKEDIVMEERLDAKAAEEKKRIESMVKEAKQFYSEENYDAAGEIFSDVLKEDPSNNIAETYLKYIEKKKAEQAKKTDEEKIREYTGRNKKDIKYRTSRGKKLFSDGLYDKAKDEFTSVLELDPKNGIAKKYLKLIDKKQEKPNEKEVKLAVKEGVKTFSSTDTEEMLLESSVYEPGQSGLGAELGDGGSAEDFRERGFYYYKKGKFGLAVADFTKVIDKDANDALVYYNRGNAYQAQGLYDQAISDFDRSIELKSDFPQSYLNRGVSYGKKEMYYQAILDFNRAIKIDPKYAEAYFNKAMAYEGAGHKRDAAEAYKEFIKCAADSNKVYVEQAKKKIEELEK